MYSFLAETMSSCCLEVLLLLQLTSAEDCWEASNVYTTFPVSVFLCPAWNKLLVTGLDIKCLGLLLYLWICLEGECLVLVWWKLTSVWWDTYDLSYLLFGVIYMIKTACTESEVSVITNRCSSIALSEILTLKHRFYHFGVKLKLEDEWSVIYGYVWGP